MDYNYFSYIIIMIITAAITFLVTASIYVEKIVILQNKYYQILKKYYDLLALREMEKREHEQVNEQ